MKEFVVTYQYKDPTQQETIQAESADEIMQKLKEKIHCHGDVIDIVEVKELKSYEVEYEYRAYQKALVGAYSEEHLRDFFDELAEHDPDSYIKNPDVVITKITEVPYDTLVKKVKEELE